MSFQGMDPQAVASVADRVDAQADVLEHIAGAVDAAIRAALDAWPGPDADDFHSWWVNQHRPRLLAAAQATRAAAFGLRGQVGDQVDASGGGGDAGGFGGLAAGLLGVAGALGRAWESSANWRALEGIFGNLGDLRAGGADNVVWSNPAFRHLHVGLGVLGTATDLLTAAEGFAENDGGKQVTGISGAVTGVAPAPIAIAGGAALLYGELTLPTNNEEYAGTYDMALRRHFGDAYDPANPTQEQAAWGLARYSGPMGFLNSISDGMDYTIDGWLPGGSR